MKQVSPQTKCSAIKTSPVSRRFKISKRRLAEFCRRHHISRLSFFGSVLRDDFGPCSDIDVLVEFEPGHTPGYLRLYDMEMELSKLFGGRKVDLRTAGDLSRYFRQQVINEAKVEYDSGRLYHPPGHILDAAEKAIKFTKDKSRASLDDDEILGFAIVRLLEIIGEAARELSAEFTKAQPEIPWAKMASMRNRLIHGYFDVDLDLVWETVKDELPPLIKKLRHISNKETGNASP